MATQEPLYTAKDILSIMGSIISFSRARWGMGHVARRVFYFLREHPELLEQADYKRVYDEMLEVVFFLSQGHLRREQKDLELRELLEFLADLFNRENREGVVKFKKEDVDEYLRYRRVAW